MIGNDNRLIWRLRTDLRRFRALTLGRPVLMGRKTFLSIGKPLPGRHNIVLTRQPGWQPQRDAERRSAVRRGMNAVRRRVIAPKSLQQ